MGAPTISSNSSRASGTPWPPPPRLSPAPTAPPDRFHSHLCKTLIITLSVIYCIIGRGRRDRPLLIMTNDTERSDREFIIRLRRERELRMRDTASRRCACSRRCAGAAGGVRGEAAARAYRAPPGPRSRQQSPDGSNWELLCVFCHENEHARHSVADWSEGPTPQSAQATVTTHNPFAGLDQLLKKK